MTIHISQSGHDFEKTNLVTLRGGYDNLKCKLCGLKARRQRLDGTALVSSSYSHSKANNCPNQKPVESSRVRVIRCGAFGKIFSNLTPGSEHNVVPTPKGERAGGGVWVMGVGEPVKLINGEFEEI